MYLTRTAKPGTLLTKLTRTYCSVFFFILVNLVLSFSSYAQNAADTLDADEFNDINKISFLYRFYRFVAFSKWIGYTTDSGRTYQQKFITLSNVDFNGYTVNVTIGFGINGVKLLTRIR
jgi:hypothetical protein